MRKSEIYGSGNWIKADGGALNLPDGPKHIALTIAQHMEISTFTDSQSGQEKKQRTIYFNELGGSDGPGLSLNNTNWSMIAALTNKDDDSEWPGSKIELYATMVPFGNKIVDAVRIREPSAPTKAEEELGEGVAKRAYDRLVVLGKNENDLRAFLVACGKFVPSGPMKTWPKSLVDIIKKGIDAECDLSKATDDIPF